jgi:hypothetical protein
MAARYAMRLLVAAGHLGGVDLVSDGGEAVLTMTRAREPKCPTTGRNLVSELRDRIHALPSTPQHWIFVPEAKRRFMNAGQKLTRRIASHQPVAAALNDNRPK